MEWQGHVKIFEHRIEHTAAAHLLLTQLGLTPMLLGDLHAECGKIFGIARQYVMRGGIGHGHGDRTVHAGNTCDQRIHLGTGDVLDRQHRSRLAMTGGKPQLAGLAGSGNTDQRSDRKNLIDLRGGRRDGTGLFDGLNHMYGKHALRVAKHGDRLGLGRIVAEFGGVDQRTQLGERNARNAGRRGCGVAKTGRIRLEAEQVDRTSRGGQQVRGHRVEQGLCRSGMSVQLTVEHRIGALVGKRHGPRRGLAGEGERVRLAVQSIEKKGVHDVPYFYCKNFVDAPLPGAALQGSEWLIAVMLGGFAGALLAGEQSQRVDDGFAGLLGIDHRVDLAHFQRQVRIDGGAFVLGRVFGPERLHVLAGILGFLQVFAMDDVHRTGGTEHCDLAGRPCIVEIRANRLGTHHDVGAAEGLA